MNVKSYNIIQTLNFSLYKNYGIIEKSFCTKDLCKIKNLKEEIKNWDQICHLSTRFQASISSILVLPRYVWYVHKDLCWLSKRPSSGGKYTSRCLVEHHVYKNIHCILNFCWCLHFQHWIIKSYFPVCKPWMKLANSLISWDSWEIWMLASWSCNW